MEAIPDDGFTGGLALHNGWCYANEVLADVAGQSR